MKSKILFVLLVICNSYLFAQTNVGIGTATPSEKLDVNGNINVQGTIKANGVAGQNNQVLMTNTSGNLVWSDLVQYKNFVGFTNPVTGQIWIVPSGITKILVEAWGAGGGGNTNGGGGGGGYIQAIFTVTPGQSVTIDVPGYTASAEFGGASVVTIGLNQAWASGGGPSFGQPGTGGMFSATVASSFGFFGESGHITTEKYEQYNSTGSFLKAIHYGNGGCGANTKNTGGIGSFRSTDVSTLAQVKLYDGQQGMSPGGGGGASASGGFGGGKGMVIIRY